MAVPKKRTGHSAQGKRRSNWKATKPTTTKCPNCGAVALAHTVCTACGQYKGKVVSRKAEGFVEATEVKEAKKAPKKSTKKAEKVEETKVEEALGRESKTSFNIYRYTINQRQKLINKSYSKNAFILSFFNQLWEVSHDVTGA